jgi:hypothetical protein
MSSIEKAAAVSLTTRLVHFPKFILCRVTPLNQGKRKHLTRNPVLLPFLTRFSDLLEMPFSAPKVKEV